MLVAAHLAALAAVLAVRYWQIDGRISPDGQYYLNIAVGRKVPMPYAGRVLVPLATRLSCAVTRADPLTAMRWIAAAGTFAFVGVVYWASPSPWYGFAAALIVISTNTLVGSWIMHECLVDSWAMTFAVGAWAAGEPWAAALLLALSAATKEGAWMLGAVACLYTQPLWVQAPAVATLVLVRLVLLVVKVAPPDRDWLKQPFKYVQISKRRTHFDWTLVLSGMKASPFVVAAVLAGTEYGVLALLLFGICWVHSHFAMDNGRVLAPFLAFSVIMAVPLCPDWLVAVWVAASVYWPLKENFS